MTKTRVLVVDDSAVIRNILSEIINGADDMEVVATANDPIHARDKIKELSPDVITLDVEMPKMDGISFLKNIMRLRPMPVVMISTLTEKGAQVTMDALALGAIDYVAKPNDNMGRGLASCEQEILDKIRVAASANISALERSVSKKGLVKPTAAVISGYTPRSNHILTIGASTGGTEAIKDILLGMPKNCPPTVVAQHIPEMFSASYAARLNNTCAMTVQEARAGQKLEVGNVYVAPGDDHLTVIKKGLHFYCALNKNEFVNRHRPSVDVLFKSVCEAAGKNATGILLTGMGADGAKGLLALKEQGCHTIIQDEHSSVVWGMPGKAASIHAYCSMKPLMKIANEIIQVTKK